MSFKMPIAVRRKPPLRVLLFGLIFFSVCSSALADTKGKVGGRITDSNKEPVIGASVVIQGTTLGAATDLDGYYSIINIPPGTYELKISAVGYTSTLVKDVEVQAGQTTTINETLAEAAVQTKEVVVVAKRPVVDTRQTSAVTIMDRKQIAVLPVQSLDDIVNLQAGVVDGHFRGGRLGEVQYQVDGVTVNNPYDNTSTMPLDKSVLQEVQVISGTFDAEYGQAMSGVVNAVLKSGSEDHFSWNFEAYTGDYYSPNDSARIPLNDKVIPGAIQSYTLSLSGPTPIPKTTFLISGRNYSNVGYMFGQRRFLPTDTSNFETKTFYPTGDNKIVPMQPIYEWSGQAKLANRSLKDLHISYQALFDYKTAKTYDFSYRLDPGAQPTQHDISLVHGFDITHTISTSAFYTISLRQNYFKHTDWVYDNVFDPRYFSAGPPLSSDINYELGAVVQGVDLTRFQQETNLFVFKGALSDQVVRNHLLKAGLEFQAGPVSFGAPGTLVMATVNGVQSLQALVDNPNYPGVETFHPVSFASYVQDIAEWHDVSVHVGVRFEYFDARDTIPSNLENPANSIQGAPLSHAQRTTPKIDIAPRLGISYPVIQNGSIYFSYGHFYQMPGLDNLYSSSDYARLLKNLSAGNINYGVGVMGNPDLKPEFTTQYEFGFKADLTDYLGLDFSIFYKDIRDLLGVQFVSTYNDAVYARFTNVDFGNVSGFTLSLIERNIGMIHTSIDYTYQVAKGNSSDPRETFNRAQAGYDPRPRVEPFDWDQRHTLNTTVTMLKPDDYSLSAVILLSSGQPYTPENLTILGGQPTTNSGRKSASVIVDLRAEKDFALGSVGISLFARVFNLFDSNFSNGFVFASTGSVDYTLNPAGEIQKLNDPSRFYEPRRVEIGVSLSHN